MNNNVKDIVLRLHNLRPNVAQFLFFDKIFGEQVIAARKSIIEFKKQHPSIQDIDVIIHSPGGMADEAYRLARTLRKNFNNVNVIVPFWAKSAATLLCLGATEIIVDEFGEFGPLDAQLGKQRDDSPTYERQSALNDEDSINLIEEHYKTMYEQMFIRLHENPQINIKRDILSSQLFDNLSKFFSPLLTQIDAYRLGERKRLLDIGAQYAKRILLQFGQAHDIGKARLLVDYLIHDCPDHGYVIDHDILKNFVSNIHSSIKFGEEYSQTLQELSMFLMETEEEDIDHVGFVQPENKLSTAGILVATEDGAVVVNPQEEIKTSSTGSNTEMSIETSADSVKRPVLSENGM